MQKDFSMTEMAGPTDQSQLINVHFPPPVLFFDTAKHRAITEYVTQRSIHNLLKYERRGLKVHTIPGDSDDPEGQKQHQKRYIVTAEFLKFLETISD